MKITIRLDTALKSKLEKLSELRAMTLNKLEPTDALGLQRELKEALAMLERIATGDLGFEEAITAAAADEAATIEDPVEGTPYIAESHAATSVVRGILGA